MQVLQYKDMKFTIVHEALINLYMYFKFCVDWVYLKIYNFAVNINASSDSHLAQAVVAATAFV